MDVPWAALDDYLKKVNRRISKIRGDGFCFITSIVECMKNDYNVDIQVQETINCIIEEMVENHKKYVSFHSVIQHEEPLVCDADLLIAEAMDFFENRNYMENVVDLLIQVAADALGLDIYIYQKNDENVQVLKYSGGPLCKPVHVKFTHNNIHSQGNHYDAILKEIKEDPDCNLHLLSDVALQQQLPTAHKHNLKHMTYENNQVFNSYVKQSNVTNLQTINIDLTTGRNYTNTQTFHGPVNNTSVTNHQIIDNKSSQSIHCSMDTQQTPSPPLAHHVLKTQNNFINKPEVIDQSKMTTVPSLNDAVLDLSMKNKHKLDDNADLINCLSDENYEMPTPDDEDLEIIGFDPAFTNEVTSEHPASTNTTTTTTNSSNQRNIPKIGRGRPFPRYLFHDLEPEVVTSIPTDIDGMKYYKVKTSIKT